ncbi:hypothetical protein DL96DRAFT_1817233 [Flagelloscypha sp. PMI_526]|nr:hypothetical protein DL96DRAFT_1817233 [Flagelloscypha sp. PMI_526]
MTSFVDLPPELLDRIFSICDKNVIVACSTVCKLVHLICRNVLFKTIRIGERNAKLLMAVMEDGFSHKDVVTDITVNVDIFDESRAKFIDFVTVLRGYPRLQLLQLITRTGRQSEKEIELINELLDDGTFGFLEVRLFGRLGTGVGWNSKNGYPCVLCPRLTDLSVETDWNSHPLQQAPSWPAIGANSCAFQRPLLQTLRLQVVPKPWSKLEEIADVSRVERFSLWISAYQGAIDDTFKGIHACSHSIRTLSIFHGVHELFPTNQFKHAFPSLTNLMLWIAYYPYPIRSWLTPMIDEISRLSPNLRQLDLYIHFPPNNILVESGTLKSTLEDHPELPELLSSISSKTKNLQHVQIWFWENSTTSEEDIAYLERVCRDFIRRSGWDGSLSFVWGVIWTEIWPFFENPSSRWS